MFWVLKLIKIIRDFKQISAFEFEIWESIWVHFFCVCSMWMRVKKKRLRKENLPQVVNFFHFSWLEWYRFPSWFFFKLNFISNPVTINVLLFEIFFIFFFNLISNQFSKSPWSLLHNATKSMLNHSSLHTNILAMILHWILKSKKREIKSFLIVCSWQLSGKSAWMIN